MNIIAIVSPLPLIRSMFVWAGSTVFKKDFQSGSAVQTKDEWADCCAQLGESEPVDDSLL